MGWSANLTNVLGLGVEARVSPMYRQKMRVPPPLGRGHGHLISSLFEPKGSCELKIGIPMHTKVLLYKRVVNGVFTDTLS